MYILFSSVPSCYWSGGRGKARSNFLKKKKKKKKERKALLGKGWPMKRNHFSAQGKASTKVHASDEVEMA